MTTDEMIAKIATLSDAEAASLLAMLEAEPTSEQVDEPKAEQPVKVKCKVCGFHKKARRVQDGVCKSCRTALDSDEPEVEVIGRMGKRGRNTVSVMIDGQRFRVKRLSSKHSERIAAKYASKPKGYARKPKAHASDFDGPKGLPTDSRLGADREQREQG